MSKALPQISRKNWKNYDKTEEVCMNSARPLYNFQNCGLCRVCGSPLPGHAYIFRTWNKLISDCLPTTVWGVVVIIWPVSSVGKVTVSAAYGLGTRGCKTCHNAASTTTKCFACNDGMGSEEFQGGIICTGRCKLVPKKQEILRQEARSQECKALELLKERIMQCLSCKNETKNARSWDELLLPSTSVIGVWA